MKYISKNIRDKPLMWFGIIGLIITFGILIIFHDVTQSAIIDLLVSDASGGEGWYNLFSISIYTIIAILSLLIINQKFIDWKIEIDDKFVVSMIPFIIFGGLLRACEDAEVIPYPISILAISPVVYFIITLIIILIMYIIKRVVKDDDKPIYKHVIVIGSTLAYLSVLPLLHLQLQPYDYSSLYKDILIFGIIGLSQLSILVFLISDRFKFYHIVYILIIIGWVLDLSITSFGITQLDYAEKNIISIVIIDTFGIIGFKIEKLLFAVVFIWVFEYKTHWVQAKASQWDWITVLAIVVLGMAPAIRNIVRIAVGI